MTKECPACGTDVPEVAKRCKTCFHDFEASGPSKGLIGSGAIALVISFAAMLVVACGVIFWIVSQPQEQKILVDEGSQSIIWTATYVTGPTTDRLDFKDIAHLEYNQYASGSFDITAVTTTGDRKVIQESVSPILGEAKKYAEMMERPLRQNDNTRGFGQ